jgi:hypothetical protein
MDYLLLLSALLGLHRHRTPAAFAAVMALVFVFSPTLLIEMSAVAQPLENTYRLERGERLQYSIILSDMFSQSAAEQITPTSEEGALCEVRYNDGRAPASGMVRLRLGESRIPLEF